MHDAMTLNALLLQLIVLLELDFCVLVLGA